MSRDTLGSVASRAGAFAQSLNGPRTTTTDRRWQSTCIEGQVLIHCHAGCDVNSVVHALGMRLTDLFDHPRGATYVYPDSRHVHRTPDQKFRQSGKTKGSSLFRADSIGVASTIYVVEG
jgi:hypothetical protein